MYMYIYIVCTHTNMSSSMYIYTRYDLHYGASGRATLALNQHLKFNP